MNQSETAARPAEPSRRAALLLSLLMLMSGLCGISYEVLYARLLGNLIGDQFAVSAAILLTFLLGIAFGTFCAHRLWKFLWLIEAGIGLYGTAMVLGIHRLDAWIYEFGGATQMGLSGAIAAGVVLVSIPAFLVGCTLPLFAGYLSRVSRGKVFGRAYALYNLGAFLTALLIEFWLLRALGLRAAVLTVAVMNGVVSLLLVLAFRPLRQFRPERKERERFATHHLSGLAVASVASAIFQLTMIRVAECIIGPFHETFALVLAIVLLGQALGSAVVQRWQLSFEKLMLINLGGLCLVVAGVMPLSFLYALFYPSAVEVYCLLVALKFSMLTALMIVPACTFGATIPALMKAQQDVARESGVLLAVSSLANAGGFLLMALVLHQIFDYGLLLLLTGTLTSLALITYYGRPCRRIAMPIGGLVVLFLTFQHGWSESLLYVGHTKFHSAKSLYEAREELVLAQRFKGRQDVVSINWTENTPYLFINGYISIPLNSSSERTVGALSSVYAPRNDRALVLGVGSGATASTVGLAFDHTDAVEINPVLLEKLPLMSEYNFDLPNMANVDLIHDDAMHYVKHVDKDYSLIVNTVTTPLYFSSSKLYTRDFLKSVRQRLTPDGVYVTWVDTRLGDRGIDIILKTIDSEFDHCALAYVKSAYFLLLCSQQPITAHQPDLIANNDTLREHFLIEHESYAEWIPYNLMTTDVLDLIDDHSVPVNTLDYPSLEFQMSRLKRRGIHKFQERLLDAMDIVDVAQAFRVEDDFDPTKLVLRSTDQLGDSPFTERWWELTRQVIPDIEESFNQQMADFYNELAQRHQTASAYHLCGEHLLPLGRYAEALEQFKLALDYDCLHNDSNLLAGTCYDHLGQHEAAEEHYQLELFADPEDQTARYRLARIYLMRGEQELALSTLDDAIRPTGTVWVPFDAEPTAE